MACQRSDGDPRGRRDPTRQTSGPLTDIVTARSKTAGSYARLADSATRADSQVRGTGTNRGTCARPDCSDGVRTDFAKTTVGNADPRVPELACINSARAPGSSTNPS